MYNITPYNSRYKKFWDDFISISRNGTFILYRDYMDYHSDRFKDASLIITDDKCRVVGLFAASQDYSTIVAHGGLTYGGLILGNQYSSASNVLDIFEAIINYYKSEGCNDLIYKAIPHIYHRYPCEEDLYAMFRHNATLCECNVSSVINLGDPLQFNQNSMRNLSKAKLSGIRVVESTDYQCFWDILTEVLQSRHSSIPVHSLSEIESLARIFPDNIQLYLAFKDDKCLAGTVMFVTDCVAHCQYIASSDEGCACGALSLLYNNLIELYTKQGLKYFDFGTSNENHGAFLNNGLIQQKNGFGGRAVVYSQYRLIF